jgi:hypothetical protein
LLGKEAPTNPRDELIASEELATLRKKNDIPPSMVAGDLQVQREVFDDIKPMLSEKGGEWLRGWKGQGINLSFIRTPRPSRAWTFPRAAQKRCGLVRIAM